MDEHFRATFEGLKQTAEGLLQANVEIKRAVEAAMSAKNEQEDLRETVQRLEALVMELTKEVGQLRQDLKDARKPN